MKRVALFDLDGTLADYDAHMQYIWNTISPSYQPFPTRSDTRMTGWQENRRKLIQSIPGFWSDLPRLEQGFEILDAATKLGYEPHILTKGPTSTLSAWREKVEWCQRWVRGAPITISQDKSLVYGRLLVDDYPPYFLPWLMHRPRGYVICVAQPWNENIGQDVADYVAEEDIAVADGLAVSPLLSLRSRILRYHGGNLDEVKEVLVRAMED